MEVGDAQAVYILAGFYIQGIYGLSQDNAKALKLFHQAAELGYARAYQNIGCSYSMGRSVELDRKKATHYWELAAMGGDIVSRHNLGCIEAQAGNTDRAVKHYMIAVKSGHNNSLTDIQMLYSSGHVTKVDFSEAL